MKALALFLLFNTHLTSASLIVCEAWPGRLGDQLILYINTQVLGYKKKISFAHRGFLNSDQFTLHYKEQPYSKELLHKYGIKSVLRVKSENDINVPDESILYVGTYFMKLNDYIFMNGNLYETVIHHPEFAQHLKEMLQPVKPVTIDLPKDRFTVAVHVRKGGGVDMPLLSIQTYTRPIALDDENNDSPEKSENVKQKYADVRFPLKFVPNQFYIDQINMLADSIAQPLHVHVFTDDPNPQKFVDLFKGECSNKNITFSCRCDMNRANRNVVEDFWLMTQFDCLIRPYSYLSLAAQLVGNHQIIIHPVKYQWHEGKLIITEAELIIPDRKEKRVIYTTLS